MKPMKVHMRISVAPQKAGTVPEPELPSKLEMAKNIAKASAQEIIARVKGVPALTQAEEDRRKSICESNRCGQYRASDARCALCGCWKKRKVAWRSQRCPMGMW